MMETKRMRTMKALSDAKDASYLVYLSITLVLFMLDILWRRKNRI